MWKQQQRQQLLLGGGKLDVVGYSTPESVYQEDLEPAFEKTSAGSGVSFSNSFGASGDQSRAVVAGQPASVVHFAQAGDMERLVEEGGLVAKDWEKQPYGGIAQDSVVVITVRKGNPEGIHTLDDVLSKDVDVVTPNPFSSGAARWNIMAVYGTLINEGKSPDQALEGVKTLLEKTTAQPGSARDALAAFTQGEGDVLLGYENEAIKAENEGEDVEHIVPPSTILIETPIAVTTSARSPRRKISSSSSGPTKARKSGPKTATARSTRSWSTRSSSRPRRNCSRSASSVAGAKSTTNSSMTKRVRSPRSRLNSGSPPQADVCAPGSTPGRQHPGQASACPGSAPASAAARSCSI